MEYISKTLEYIIQAGEITDQKAFTDVIQKGLSKETGEKTMTTFAEIFRQEGKEIGLEKGLQEGLEQGLREGLEQGKKETIKTIVLQLLKSGIEVDQIVNITKLSKKDINKIKESLEE